MKNKQKISRHEETTFRKASAGTRDHWEVQPVTDAITRQPEGKDNAAVARFPQVAAPESGKVSGDQHYRASQDNGKRKPVFDSLVGKYPVPVIRVPNLLEVIVSEENFLRAIKEINSAPDKACGIDRKSVRDVCEQLENSADRRELIREDILKGTYHPGWVKVIQIPKPSGGKRTLGIATVRDRIVQRMILNAVEDNLPDNAWSPYSFAFLRNHSVADAIAEVNKIREEGYKYAIKLDLKSFFDNVPHDRLLEKVWHHIVDRRVVSLIRKFLTPIMCRLGEDLWRNRIGSPQGSIISPWLTSKLYLDELDKELSVRGHRFVRYADDITVFCRSYGSARRVKAKLIDFVEQTLKCPVNRGKSTIVDISHLSLLGVVFVNGKWQIDREKRRDYCSIYLHGLRLFQRTGDETYFRIAVASLQSTLAYYRGIPGIALRRIHAMERWAVKRMKETILEMPPKKAKCKLGNSDSKTGTRSH
ncbi:MAG: hypothetical protein MJ033_07235 [Victivallaceae bacterium]|nr:hypothetical protein [Victivallaceae bacterium]